VPIGVGAWGLALKNLFLPIFCKQCGARLLTEENGYFCPDCWEISPRIERPFCPVCGRPHRGGIGLGTQVNFLCAACSAEKQQRPYRRILGACHYGGAIETAIKLCKFHDKRRLAGPLAETMADIAGRELDCEVYDFLVPVPLHRVRRRARGFNQALLLAREVQPQFPRAVIDESLHRIRPTRVQSRLKDPAERRANVKGAFAIVNGDHLRGKNVLLIDDVVTTAGTVAECAQVLRDHGVALVDVLAVALAVPELRR
jgi:ComF family protein